MGGELRESGGYGSGLGGVLGWSCGGEANKLSTKKKKIQQI